MDAADEGEHEDSSMAHRLFGCKKGCGSVLCHNVRRNQLHHCQNAERYDHRVIEVTQDRNEIRYEVRGARAYPATQNANAFAYQGTRGSRAAKEIACASRLIVRAQTFSLVIGL